ncbi:MAG: TolC family protein, partial [Bacteroidota bacterium]|nr:TolC family protein [Bacteroidota bacterium]
MVNVKQLAILFLFTIICPLAYGQIIVMSEQQVVDSAVKNSPAISAAQYQVLQQQQIRRSAFNLPNPEVLAESPTGDFYTIGVLQTFEFPSVYFKQSQVYRQQEQLSSAGQKITENDVKYQVKLLYVQLQFMVFQTGKLRVQDSLYAEIKTAANRQFAAGQIDFLQNAYAESQYGEIHNKLVNAETDLLVTQQQLQNFTGIAQTITPLPIQRAQNTQGITALKNDTNLFMTNPLLTYYRQQQVLNKKLISLERNRILPGFVIGYMNQGPMSTPVNMRFRMGITVPLWFWQYSGNVKAARYRFLESGQVYKANRQQLSNQQIQAQGNYFKYKQSLDYYESTGLKLSEGLITSSARFYTSGQYDLVAHLRNLNDAYQIQ